MNEAQKIAKEIFESKKVCVLTGAGISTESGVPDFRSPGTGLWTKFDPSILSADMLLNNPERFYRKGLEILKSIGEVRNAKPNIGHKILAKLEKEKYIDCIITQNIDGLHKKAGSENVYEAHGNLRDAYCITCGKEYSFAGLTGKIENGQIPPLCDECGGIIRPGVVLFGDPLPEIYEEAIKEVKKSNLLLVIGSSLEVSPVNYLPDLSTKYIIINKEKTAFDRAAHIVWHQKAGNALKMIYKEIKKHEEKD